jgi:hypothetical protein
VGGGLRTTAMEMGSAGRCSMMRNSTLRHSWRMVRLPQYAATSSLWRRCCDGCTSGLHARRVGRYESVREVRAGWKSELHCSGQGSIVLPVLTGAGGA